MADRWSGAEIEAAKLRDQTRTALAAWLEERGLRAEVGISGYVSPAGEPRLLITIGARVAAEMVRGITADKPEPTPQAPPPPQQAPPGTWPPVPPRQREQ
jgi:hypothetical protein